MDLAFCDVSVDKSTRGSRHIKPTSSQCTPQHENTLLFPTVGINRIDNARDTITDHPDNDRFNKVLESSVPNYHPWNDGIS